MEGVNSQDYKTSVLLNDSVLSAKSQYRLEREVQLTKASNPLATFMIEYNGQRYVRGVPVTYP
jgi:hypothetical protein